MHLHEYCTIVRQVPVQILVAQKYNVHVDVRAEVKKLPRSAQLTAAERGTREVKGLESEVYYGQMMCITVDKSYACVTYTYMLTCHRARCLLCVLPAGDGQAVRLQRSLVLPGDRQRVGDGRRQHLHARRRPRHRAEHAHHRHAVRSHRRHAVRVIPICTQCHPPAVRVRVLFKMMVVFKYVHCPTQTQHGLLILRR